MQRSQTQRSTATAFNAALARHAREACDGFDPKVVIDTGRNGRVGMRQDCSWPRALVRLRLQNFAR